MSLPLDLVQELLLIARARFKARSQHPVALRVERLEAEVLELELQGVEAEAFGDRRVDVERLARDPALLLGGSDWIVRMLCVRSASFTRITRRSRTIASSILRKLSACASAALLNWM